MESHGYQKYRDLSVENGEERWTPISSTNKATACARCPTYSRPSGSVVSTAECPLKLYAQLTLSQSKHSLRVVVSGQDNISPVWFMCGPASVVSAPLLATVTA